MNEPHNEKTNEEFDKLADQLREEQGREHETQTAKEMAEAYLMLRNELQEQGLDEDAARQSAFLTIMSNLLANWGTYFQRQTVILTQGAKQVDMQLTQQITGTIVGVGQALAEKIDNIGE